MAVLGIKDPTTKLEDVRQYISSDKNYFSILNRPVQDLLQRDEDLNLITTPARGLRVRATDPTTDQVEVEVGTFLSGVTISQFAGTTLAAVPAASASNKRIDLLYFRIDTGTVVRSPSAEAANYGAVVKINLPAGLDTIPLAYLYVGDTGPDFQDGLAVNTDGAIEDLRPAPGSSMGRQLETAAGNILTDVSGGDAGSAETVVRSDHRHGLNVDGTLPPSLVPGNVGAAGSAGTYARIDHIHLIPTETNPAALQEDLVGGSVGVGANFARSDHQHDVNVGSNIPGVDSGVGSAGAANVYARDDHFHPINAPTSPLGGFPVTINPLTAADHGVSPSYARSDHVHDTSNLAECRVIFGEVASAGGIARAGSGDWTSIRNGLGFYRVTFNTPLTTLDYVVTANAVAPTLPGSIMVPVKILDRLLTFVEFFTGRGDSGAAFDSGFGFQIMVIPV